MFRSLWFRLTGTVVFVVVVTMLVVLVASLVIMRREFVDFVNTALANLQVLSPESEVFPSEPSSRSPRITEDRVVIPLPEIVNRDFPGTFIERTLPNIDVQVPQIVQNEATNFLETTRDTVLIAVGISAGLAILASTWLFWQITRPLAKLRSAAEAIAGGDLETRVPVKSRDEVGRVASAFNHMATELERQEHLRSQMVADVAHELRTPLSVMRGNLEAMQDELIAPSAEELDALHQEVLRLGRLVEDLRLLSLADAGKLHITKDRVDAADLVETAVRRLTPVAKYKGVTLVGDIGQTAPGAILGDEDKLHQVLANLIGNAIRYTPVGGRVTVQALAAGEEVQLVVCDQGPGVDPAELPYLFDRFWKANRARSRNGGGSGLGLSIVWQLVELHGGQVVASLPEEGGLRVTVTLPSASHLGNILE